MAGRILVVTDDKLEWQAVSRELGMRFDLLRANGRDQALALVDREGDLSAIVAWWGPLSSGPELMRAVSMRKAKLPRVLIAERPDCGDAQAVVAEGVVRAVVADPSAVIGVLERPAPSAATHPVRAEPRRVVRVQLQVSTTAWQGFLPLFTKDVSRGGAFFFFAQRVVPTSGTPCTVKVGNVEVAGSVAHVMTARLATATNTDAGFGVSFTAAQTGDWWAPLIAQQQAPPPPVTATARAVPVTPSAGAAPVRTSAPTAKDLESAKNFHALGMSFYEARNYGLARQKFELAGRCAPDPKHEAMQACCHGQQHARTGNPDQAREAFRRALSLDPSCAAATTALASLKR